MNNHRNRKIKKWVTGSIITTMMLTGTAYAETPAGSGTSGQANPPATQNAPSNMRLGFPDVPASHWAAKHIAKLSLLGIIQGNDLGKFDPDSQVSQQDVIIMAIRMMGLESQVPSSGSTVVLPFEVRDDARPYVALAIEKGLINLQEESAAASKWGSRSASREWVAKIVVRAIGKQDEAAGKANIPTPFKDNNKISTWAVGYINAAASLHLVNGFEDGTFRPDGSVTRAQMAAFLSRAEKYLEKPPERVFQGFVTGIDGNRWTVENRSGQSMQVQMNPNAVYFIAADDTKRLTAADIKLYSEVYLIQDRNTGYYAELISDEVPMQSIEGTLVGVDIAKLTITVMVNGMETTYNLASNVTALDKNGGGVSLGSLIADSVLELKRNSLIKDAKISQIVVKQVPVNKTVDGTFKSIDPQAKTVTLTESATGQTETYPLADAATFKLGDKTFDPVNLSEGDTIRLDIKNGKAVSLLVLKQLVEKRDQGKLYSISDDNSVITIQKAGDELAAYKLSEQVKVVIEGNLYAGIRDLLPGDELKLEINSMKVDRIIVTGRSIQNHSMATIVSYDADNKFVFVKDEFGNPDSYVLTDKTRILFDDTEIPLQSFPSIFVKGKKVNLAVSQKKLVSIQIATRLEGTIAQVNTAAGELTLKTPSNLVYTYKWVPNPVVEIAGKPTAAVSDLKAGDTVRVQFNASQDQISQIQVRTALVFRTLSKDAAAQKITVQETETTSAAYSLNGIPIVKPGQSALTLASIPLDEPVEFDFVGKTLEAVQLVDTVRGKVTAVDAANGKLTVTDYTNASRVVEAGASFTVKSGANMYTTLDAVKPDDRVEAVKDSKGHTHITVLSGEQRTVSSYNADSREITFKRRTLSDRTTYVLHEKAYVHQGAELLSPNFLLENDNVQVYIAGDKIVELAK